MGSEYRDGGAKDYLVRSRHVVRKNSRSTLSKQEDCSHSAFVKINGISPMAQVCSDVEHAANWQRRNQNEQNDQTRAYPGITVITDCCGGYPRTLRRHHADADTPH